jgi:hypothetical protein
MLIVYSVIFSIYPLLALISSSNVKYFVPLTNMKYLVLSDSKGAEEFREKLQTEIFLNQKWKNLQYFRLETSLPSFSSFWIHDEIKVKIGQLGRETIDENEKEKI